MDLSTITVADFKAQFYRDFPYLPVYSATELYNTGDQVYYPTTKLFYSCLVNGVTGVTPGSDGTKWAVYSDSLVNYIQDQDISNTFAEAQAVFNQALFSADATLRLAYLYVSAHFLCNDIKASMGGIVAQGAFPVMARAVAGVSESYAIPKAYTDSPILSFYTQSAYGMKYLAMVLPALTGNFGAVHGGTNP